MLTLRLHMEFDAQACGEAAAVLRSLIGPVRAEPGCRATRLMSDAAEACHLTWVEEWRSVEDFERHLRRDTFRRMLAVMDLANRRPGVEIDDIASRRGFELVEEILGMTPAGRAGNDIGHAK